MYLSESHNYQFARMQKHMCTQAWVWQGLGLDGYVCTFDCNNGLDQRINTFSPNSRLGLLLLGLCLAFLMCLQSFDK